MLGEYLAILLIDTVVGIVELSRLSQINIINFVVWCLYLPCIREMPYY